MIKIISKDNAIGFYFSMEQVDGPALGISRIYSSPEQRDESLQSIRNCADANVQDNTGVEVYHASCPKFELINVKTGEYSFRFKDVNDEIVITSQSFDTRKGCTDAIAEIKANAADAVVEVVVE